MLWILSHDGLCCCCFCNLLATAVICCWVLFLVLALLGSVSGFDAAAGFSLLLLRLGWAPCHGLLPASARFVAAAWLVCWSTFGASYWHCAAGAYCCFGLVAWLFLLLVRCCYCLVMGCCFLRVVLALCCCWPLRVRCCVWSGPTFLGLVLLLGWAPVSYCCCCFGKSFLAFNVLIV